MTHFLLLERAKQDRNRAERCRDLIDVIRNRESIGILEELAQELEARARELELQAREIATQLRRSHDLSRDIAEAVADSKDGIAHLRTTLARSPDK